MHSISFVIIISIDQIMKKKPSLKKTFRQLIKAQENQLSTSSIKRYKIQLPKLASSDLHSCLTQKTLSTAIKVLEAQLESLGVSTNRKIGECLNFIRDQIDEYQNKNSLNIRMTQSCLNSTALEKQNQENKSSLFKGNKSQVFNVSRSQVRKVESKDLFEKATTAKHLKGDLINVKTSEVIAVLKNKIEEKDITIRKLHSHLDEINSQLNELKGKVMIFNSKGSQAQEEKTALSEANRVLKERIQEIEALLKNKKEMIKSLKDKNISLGLEYKQVKDKLKQREGQITALYRTYQTFMN